VPTFVDRGCDVVSVTDPYGRNFCFIDGSRYFFFQVALQNTHEAQWTPFQTPVFLRITGSAEIEPGPLDLLHYSYYYYYYYYYFTLLYFTLL
jgi:hypothetical protein